MLLKFCSQRDAMPGVEEVASDIDVRPLHPHPFATFDGSSPLAASTNKAEEYERSKISVKTNIGNMENDPRLDK